MLQTPRVLSCMVVFYSSCGWLVRSGDTTWSNAWCFVFNNAATPNLNVNTRRCGGTDEANLCPHIPLAGSHQVQTPAKCLNVPSWCLDQIPGLRGAISRSVGRSEAGQRWSWQGAAGGQCRALWWATETDSLIELIYQMSFNFSLLPNW